jgi:ABC-2 type transport system permease protein
MKAFAIAVTDFRRLLRWRANVFFLVILPLSLILLLGAAFGGAGQARIGIVGGERGLAHDFVAALDARPSTELRRYDDRAALQEAVSRGEVDVGLVVPADYGVGKPVRLGYIGRPDEAAQQLRATIQSVAAEQSRVLIAAREVGLQRAQAAVAAAPGIRVVVREPDGSPYTTVSNRFELGAATQLLLFVFLNSLSGAVWLIETRRLGVARRMLSTPTSTGTILAGQVLGRLTIALLQALIIIVGSMLFFGVSWGDPAGTAAVVISFALVGTGAAVLLGSLFDSEQQAGPVALLLGLGLAALGGSMVPLEVFPDTARAIAHVTPHAWANDAFSALLVDGDGLAAVLPQVGVLLAMAAVALVVATWRLRRAITA